MYIVRSGNLWMENLQLVKWINELYKLYVCRLRDHQGVERPSSAWCWVYWLVFPEAWGVWKGVCSSWIQSQPSVQRGTPFKFYIIDTHSNQPTGLRIFTLLCIEIKYTHIYIYTERQKKLITSSKRHTLKSNAFKWIIIGHRLAKILLTKHI